MEIEGSRSGKPHLVLVVSDGTGITGERVVRAALTQFDPASVIVERIEKVRDASAITAAVEQAAQRGATVLYSLVVPAQRRQLLAEARRNHVGTIDLLGPILGRLSDVLKALPHAEPGLFHQLDEEYFRRTDAIAFAVKHDDGRLIEDLPSADLVLIGVSRTTKTPLSMILAYRGWRVANVPIVLGIEPPPDLFDLDPSKVIALAALPTWLEAVRRARSLRMARRAMIDYDEPRHIKEELIWFRQVVHRGGWTTVDVTRKAIEETAAEIVALLRG